MTFEGLIPILLIAAVFWLLIAMPARRRQKQFAATQNAVAVGSRIMLASGIFGTVIADGESSIEVEIAPGTIVTVARQAVARVLYGPEGPPQDNGPVVGVGDTP